MESATTAIRANEDSKGTTALDVIKAPEALKAAGQNKAIEVSTETEPSWVAILRRQPMNNLHKLGYT